MARHRTHSIEFKRQIAQEFVAGETLHALAKRHDLSRNLIRIWVAKLEAGAFDEDARAADMLEDYEAKIAALERMIGRQALEIEFLKGALRSAPRPRSATTAAVHYDAALLASWLTWLAPYVTFATALLPAFGAAVSGIRFTGDFEGFVQRSFETGEKLAALAKTYEAVLAELTLEDTNKTLVETAQVMGDDLTGWHALYAGKRLTLPA